MSPAELTAWATVAIAVVTAGVGATICILVWHGIREMRRSSDERARDRKASQEADIRRHEAAVEAERLRHEEVMEALAAQNRISDAQNRILEAQSHTLEAQSRILDAQSRALQALVERTAPAAPAG